MVYQYNKNYNDITTCGVFCCCCTWIIWMFYVLLVIVTVPLVILPSNKNNLTYNVSYNYSIL